MCILRELLSQNYLRADRWKTSIAKYLSVGMMTGFATIAAHSGDLSTTSTVLASVAPACTISTSAIAFGILTGGTSTQLAQSDSTNAATATCTDGYSFTVTSNAGVNSAGNQRQMKHSTAAAYIAYNLYTNSARTSLLTASTGFSFTGAGGAQNIVYARIPSQSAPLVGVYADTLTITATF